MPSQALLSQHSLMNVEEEIPEDGGVSQRGTDPAAGLLSIYYEGGMRARRPLVGSVFKDLSWESDGLWLPTTMPFPLWWWSCCLSSATVTFSFIKAVEMDSQWLKLPQCTNSVPLVLINVINRFELGYRSGEEHFNLWFEHLNDPTRLWETKVLPVLSAQSRS